jgi:hypothetical protein
MDGGPPGKRLERYSRHKGRKVTLAGLDLTGHSASGANLVVDGGGQFPAFVASQRPLH